LAGGILRFQNGNSRWPWSACEKVRGIGVARGALGAPAPPGRWKKFYA